MQLPLESVPNVSEGRDPRGRSTRSGPRSHGTRDAARRPHRRRPQPLGVHARRRRAAARRRADRRHRVRARADRPAHATPARIRGSAPPTSCRSCRFVPRTWSARVRRRSSSPARIGDELGLPRLPLRRARARPRACVLPARRDRRSCSAGSTRARSRRTSGRRELDPAAGGVIVGARRPLIAFNVNLVGANVEAAQAIARVIRERDGGFPGRARARARAAGGGSRAGEHERRGLGGQSRCTRSSRRSSARRRRRASRSRARSSSGSMPAGAAAAAAGADLAHRRLRRVAAARAAPARRRRLAEPTRRL